MSAMKPLEFARIVQGREEAVAFRDFIRALPSSARAKVSASMYPDKSGADRFKVSAKIARMSPMDGVDQIQAIRAYVQSRGELDLVVYRGGDALPVMCAPVSA